ncbi:MAG: gliding motility protein GldL [Muribaculaceae bacterium]|nr:gliding motility protein GldL [Muribaculaceae bacterium]
MGKIKRYKNSIERFLSGENGQRFFNFAYSIGAAIVIWGALFKILHLPGGNMLLCIGMGTEVMMFILTAFDRPGRDYHWEEVFPVLSTKDPEDRPDFSAGVVTSGQPAVSGGMVSDGYGLSADDSRMLSESIAKMAAAGEQLAQIAELTTVTQRYLTQMASIAEEMRHLKDTTEALNRVSVVLLDSYKAITENSENITASSTGYVEQMQNLNRNVSGLNTIYEIQLKSVSSQLDAIDRVNKGIKDISHMYEETSSRTEQYSRETERMAENMRRLNQVYEQMLQAMTVNMYRPMAAPAGVPAEEQA